MPLYEHILMARQDISTQQVEALTDNLKSIIEEGGGSIAKSEYWGLKPIAYRIKKNRKAHYTLMNIDAPHEAVAEMERLMRLNSDVLRFLTLKVEAHEEGPSAMTRKRERDDRRGPRPGGPRGDRPHHRSNERPEPKAEESRS